MTLASRIAVMSEGRLLQVGAPEEIYETPSSRFVADFIGNVNLMQGTVAVDEADHVIIDCADCRHYVGHGITGTQGMAVWVAVRPEKIQLSAQAPVDDFNYAYGRVESMSYFGSVTLSRIKLGSGQVIAVSQANHERYAEQFSQGDAVWANWSTTTQVVLTQ